MTRRPTPAEQVDRVVGAILSDQPIAAPSSLADELAVARALRAGLAPVPPSDAFTDTLARLLRGEPAARAGHRLNSLLRDHHRLVLTGALGSVLISTASAAVVAWRMAHR